MSAACAPPVWLLACRQTGHASKLSLLLVTLSSFLAEDNLLSVEAAASMGLARTLFMESRAAYGPTIHAGIAMGLPSCKVRSRMPYSRPLVLVRIFLSHSDEQLWRETLTGMICEGRNVSSRRT